MSPLLLTTFKAISVTFAFSAIWTGIQGLLFPISFSRFFGLPIPSLSLSLSLSPSDSSSSSSSSIQDLSTETKSLLQTQNTLLKSYTSTTSSRQLSTGLILLLFAHDQKWREIAQILMTIGIVVAGSDGWLIARGCEPKGLENGIAKGMVEGNLKGGIFHAIPGGMISALSVWVLWQGVV